MDKASVTLDTIAQALVWAEYKGAFSQFMIDHEYDSYWEAVKSFRGCCEAYQLLQAEKDSLVELVQEL